MRKDTSKQYKKNRDRKDGKIKEKIRYKRNVKHKKNTSYGIAYGC